MVDSTNQQCQHVTESSVLLDRGSGESLLPGMRKADARQHSKKETLPLRNSKLLLQQTVGIG